MAIQFPVSVTLPQTDSYFSCSGDLGNKIKRLEKKIEELTQTISKNQQKKTKKKKSDKTKKTEPKEKKSDKESAKNLKPWDEVKPAPTSAQITVHLPKEARLWVDDTFCPLDSDQRIFVTPGLEKGQKYAYMLRVELVRDGQRTTQCKEIEFAAGEHVDVDFDGKLSMSVSRR